MGVLRGNRIFNLMFLDLDVEFSKLHRVEAKAGTVGISGGGLTSLLTEIEEPNCYIAARRVGVVVLRIPSHRVTHAVSSTYGIFSKKRTT